MMGKKEELEDNHRSPSSHHNQKRECFVGYSHKALGCDDIIGACNEALPKFGLQPWYADDQFEPTKSLRDKVVDMIANARYGIYDLSWWQPDEKSAWKMPQNVLIELGMAIALNRPVLLLHQARNRALGLSLPTCLDSISQRIVEFSGGPTLKHALEERLPQWLDVPPERAWWMRYCLFGERTCTYRESYPQIIQCGQKTIGCHIADGKDIDRPDFRSLIEDELGRYSDISFDYLDALLPTAGYDFQLCTYCQTVRSTPFAIYRITPETTAETFIAIGMSIALEKQFKCEIPKFIFTTDARSVPSLLAGYEVVEATKTWERQKHLRKFIPVIMRKVQENVWKPKPLPFADVLQPRPETFFSETSEAKNELALSGSEKQLFNLEVIEEELKMGVFHPFSLNVILSARQLTEEDYETRKGVIRTLEGIVTFVPGDYLMQGVEHEEWPMTQNSFHAIYERTSAVDKRGFALYRSHVIHLAYQVSEAFAVKSTNGDVLRGKAGDYLVKSNDIIWIKDRDIFERTYELVSDKKSSS